MELQQTATKFLHSGFLLQVDYVDETNQEKYAYLMFSKFYNKLPNVLPKCEKENLIWNVVTNNSFSFGGKLLQGMKYLVWPDNIEYEDVVTANISIDCFKDEKFVDEVALHVLELKLSLQEHLRNNKVEVFDSTELQELQDRCILSFYPKEIVIDEQTFYELRKTIIDDFFTYAKQTLPEESSLQVLKNLKQEELKDISSYEALNVSYPALKMYGIQESLIDSNDKKLVEAFKRQWLRLIQKEKNSLLTQMQDVDLSSFSEEERIEFQQEAEFLEKEINNNIEEGLSQAKTLREVASFWPKFLQPIPSYVLS